MKRLVTMSHASFTLLCMLAAVGCVWLLQHAVSAWLYPPSPYQKWMEKCGIYHSSTDCHERWRAHNDQKPYPPFE